MTTPLYNTKADAEWPVDPADWRRLPQSEPTDDDEDVPTSQHVIDVLGFDPDEEDWDTPTDNVFCPTGPGGGVDPTCSPGGGTIGAPSAALFGHQPTAVLRWMGKEGWSFKEARAVMDGLGVDMADATLRAQLRAGKVGERGDPAKLTEEQSNKLKEWRTQPPKSEAGKKEEPAPTPARKTRTKKEKEDDTGPRPPTGLSRPEKVTEFTHRVWDKLKSGDRSLEHLQEVGSLIHDEVQKRVGIGVDHETRQKWTAQRDSLLERRTELWERIHTLQESSKDASKEYELMDQTYKEITALNRKIDPAAYDVREVDELFRKELIGALSEVRAMGDGSMLNLKEAQYAEKEDLEYLRKSASLLPKEWVYEDQIIVDLRDRGGYNEADGWGRTRISAKIGLGPFNRPATATHELIHAAETKNPDLATAQRDFLKSRIKPDEKMVEVYEGEWAYKDELPLTYAGRIYRYEAAKTTPGYVPYYGHYEILSCGVEGLLHGNRPIAKDVGYRNFVLGCLAGM